MCRYGSGMSIRKSMILILILCLAAVAAGASVAARVFSANQAENSFRRNASAQLDRVEDIIQTYLRSGQAAARAVAAWPETRTAAASPGSAAARDALAARLAALQNGVPGIMAAFSGFRDGSRVPTAPLPGEFDPRATNWYSDAAWGPGDTVVTEAFISESGRGLAATIAARVTDNGDVTGVAAVDLDLGPLTDTLRDIRFGPSGYLLLFDAKGRVLLDPESQDNLMLPAADTGDAALLALVQSPGEETAVSRADREYAAFSRSLAVPRWKAVLLVPAGERTAPARETALWVTAVAGLLTLLLAAGGTFAAFAATRPLYALIAQSEALADGDTEALAGIPGRGPDIAALHGNLGRLTGRVMLLAQAEKEKAEALEARSRLAAAVQTKAGEEDKIAREARLTAYRETADALGPLSSDLAGTVTSLDAQNQATADCLARTLAAMRDAAAMAQDAAQDAASLAGQGTETEQSAGAALLAARSGEALAREASQALETAWSVIKPMPSGLESLKNTAGDMGVTASAIRELGEKANMLSLNLSIEGAGAGEHGAAFSRSADEIRAFAAQSMALAEAMDSALSLFEQGYAAHALAAGKGVAAAKRALAMAPSLTAQAADITRKVTVFSEQSRVLATSLAGAQELAANGYNAAAALAAMGRETETLAAHVAGTVRRLTVLSAHLAAVAEDAESEADVVILSKIAG